MLGIIIILILQMKLSLSEVTYLCKISAMAYYGPSHLSDYSDHGFIHNPITADSLNFLPIYWILSSGRLSKEKKHTHTHGNCA